MQNRTRTIALALLVSGSLLGAAACGDDDDNGNGDDTEATTGDDANGDEGNGDEGNGDEGDGDEGEGDEGAAGDTVEVTGVDYAFEGLPDTVEAGTTFSFTNEGEELHEMVAFLIPEEEDRSIDELVQLEDEELGEVFGGEPMPEFVLMAEPGEDGTMVFPPDGEATVTEPGRYGVVCFIPVGMTEMPEGEQEGPPEGDGPPHAFEGMTGEFTVE
jgi:plastocyanin